MGYRAMGIAHRFRLLLSPLGLACWDLLELFVRALRCLLSQEGGVTAAIHVQHLYACNHFYSLGR